MLQVHFYIWKNALDLMDLKQTNKQKKDPTCNSRQIILQASAVPIKADIIFLWKYILKC